MRDAEAHNRYDAMLETIRNADSLHYESAYHWAFGDPTYAIWLEKPAFVRLEASDRNKNRKGVLVGDGTAFWIFWPSGRPRLGREDPAEYQKNRLISFMRHICPANEFSLAHQIGYLGVGMGMTIFEPSVFHGYEDQMEPYLDGLRGRGEESIGGETCHVIEASFMDGQRIRQYWISRRDNLPRRLREIVRCNEDIVTEEKWSNVSVNARIPPGTFCWAPHPHWVEYCPPALEEVLLKAGTPAPDFEHRLSDGTTFRLSRHRGKVVWLVFWRVGCQACRTEMVHLESVYQEYRDRGVIVIGFNCADKHEIVAEFLEKHSISFPTILDHSEAAIETFFTRYLDPDGPSGVPVNYIINKAGVIVDAWCGFSEDDARGIRAVRSEMGTA